MAHFTQLSTTAMIVALCAGSATAQDAFVGASIGGLSGTNLNGDQPYSGATAVIDGSYGYTFGDYRLIVDGRMRAVDLKVNEVEDLDDNRADNALFAVHALYGMRDNLDLGAFVTGGTANNGDGDGEFALSGYGIEAHYQINDDFGAYGQIGGFGAERDASSPNGTQDGKLIRIGATYNGLANTSLYADIQVARAADYEDEGEDYAFHNIAIGGETMLGGTQLAATYELAFFGTYSIADEGETDEMRAAEASIGIRYYFGNTSAARANGHIGAPSLISESNMWSEFHD
ncbi:hypothetical protein SAMN04488005_1059 [Yoonia tamlensis]|uniref:Porin n=1 Tax=Yoonia tamlensis TaxID=390270 RepID=A0A1I6G4B6_9RHOB|nr:hypothetical protein [Yoonia tamlensis]SFR37048.1 hypothetical protein SAMN04488005_1059 [Yoonia tamlensis]